MGIKDDIIDRTTHCSVLQVHCLGEEVDANGSLRQGQNKTQNLNSTQHKTRDSLHTIAFGVTDLVCVIETVIHESCDERSLTNCREEGRDGGKEGGG